MLDLRVTMVQADIMWHDIDGNLERFERILKSAADPGDVVVLPEMFTTGFTMKPAETAETMDGKTVTALRRWAHELDRDITGSAVITENGRYYNRVLWAKPGGEVLEYDKRHLFRMAGEEKVYSGGDELLTVEVKGWRLRPFVCYDLRFPVWTRNAGMAYDVALFMASWPAKRSYHWNSLLRARAIENQCYVIGVNRTGIDGNGVEYDGESAAIDCLGMDIMRAGRGEWVHTVELYRQAMNEYRRGFPAWKDADGFTLS